MFVSFFRHSCTDSMSLFKTAPWNSEFSARSRSKIFRVTSYVDMKRLFVMKFSQFEKLQVSHFAAKYSAKHRCTKCGFPSIISLIIPNCTAVPFCKKLLACSKSMNFTAPRSSFPSLRENKDIKDAIMCCCNNDSFSIFTFGFVQSIPFFSLK